MRARIVSVTAFLIATGPALAGRAGTLAPEDTKLLTELNRELVTVTRSVTPAVVNIASTKIVRTAEGADPFFRQFFGELYPQIPRERREQALGSGVIVDPSGVIVTNSHVVEHASSVKVGLSDGRELDAEIIGTDPV